MGKMGIYHFLREKYKNNPDYLQIEEKYKNRLDSYYKLMVLGGLDAKRIERYEKMLEFIESVYKSIPTSRPLPENREIINTFRYLSLGRKAPEHIKKDLYWHLLNFKDQKVEISRIKQVLQDFIEELPKIKRIYIDFKRFENYLQIVENFPELKGSLYLIELKPDKLHDFMKVYLLYKDMEVPLYRLVDVVNQSRPVRIKGLITPASKIENKTKIENFDDCIF